jgi:N,N'-diacetyllegionaminate synthase
MQSFKIGNKEIGVNSPMLIIAEIASAHEGRFKDMLKLVDFAIETGADAIKFQVMNQASHITPSHSIYDLVGQLEFNEEQWINIVSYTRSNSNLVIMTDVYDIVSIEIVKKMNPDIVKIHSADLNNKQLVREVAWLKKPSMIGVGASSLEEIRKAIHWFKDENDSSFLSIMDGYQGFPTKIVDMNINQISLLQDLFGIPVGFLDHTEGDSEESIFLSIAARSLGAFAVEKHIVLDRGMKGIDYQSALSMPFFKKFISQIRTLESALGEKTPKSFSPGEQRYRDFMKKDIVACEFIRKGDKFTHNNITLKRSNGGLSQKYFDLILDRMAKVNITKNEIITFKKIS